MLLSIIIPTCNRIEHLGICLAKIVAQIPRDGSIEIIVTDDGALKSSRQLIEHSFPDVNWVQGPRRGPAANRNSGARQARGEWLIFVDDDCLPGEQWLNAYQMAIKETQSLTNWLVGKTYQTTARPSLLWEAPTYHGENSLPPSCNFAMNKTTYHLTGGFDERYKYSFEDMEFFARLKCQGMIWKYVPEAKIEHPFRYIPSAAKLASRWDSKVIFAFDQGANSFRVLWNLPWHVLRITQARFRGCAWTQENRRAFKLYFQECLYVILWTPGWVKKWSSKARSAFWTDQVRQVGPIPKFGF